MIYLIKSASYNIENNEFEFILKIGYTDDNSSNIRFGTYKNHNPTCQVLYTISDATKDQEDMLHAFFKRFRKYNREWYEYNEEILNYFEIHKTKEDLDNSLIQDIYNLDPKLLPTRFRRRLQNSDKKHTSEKIKQFIEFHPEEYDLNNKLMEFEITPYFSDKLKLVCTTEFSEELQNKFLKLVPQVFENYYKVIGPEKCKALKYCNESIKSEYEKLLSNQGIDIKSELYKEFQVGLKYTKSDIKERLGKIFEKCNYKATPKASELEKYFELKECLISNKETGKREHGYEIIGKK